MWNKALKISLAAAILFGTSITMFAGSKAAAVGVDTVVKLAGGKAVVRSLAEEAGMMLSPKQLDNMVSVIQKKTYDGDTKAIDFVNKANQVINVPVGAGSKPGFQKYVLEPALWLSGLDIIFDVVGAFQDGYENSTPVDMFAQCQPKTLNNVIISASEGYSMFDVPSKSERILWVYNPLKVKVEVYTPTTGSAYARAISLDGATQSVKEYKRSISSTGDWSLFQTTTTTVTSYGGSGGNMIHSSDFAVCSNAVEEDEVITINDVKTQNIQNHFDNDTYDNDTTYNIEIEMPDSVADNTVDYGDTTVWNMPDSELEMEITPSTDTDNDDGKGDSIDVLVRVDDEIPIHEKFFLEMADMGQKIEDMYNGVVHFFDVTVNGFTSLTDGMSGFTSFLDSFFDWLPNEFKTLLGAGFTLGVVSFFLRR